MKDSGEFDHSSFHNYAGISKTEIERNTPAFYHLIKQLLPRPSQSMQISTVVMEALLGPNQSERSKFCLDQSERSI